MNHNTNFQQCELPLLMLPQSTEAASATYIMRKKQVDRKSQYWTTQQVLQILKLHSPYPLRKAKSHGSAYWHDGYVVVPIGRNQWELFKRCTA